MTEFVIVIAFEPHKSIILNVNRKKNIYKCREIHSFQENDGNKNDTNYNLPSFSVFITIDYYRDLINSFKFFFLHFHVFFLFHAKFQLEESKEGKRQTKSLKISD